MMHPQKAFAELLRQDRRYRPQAYELVWEALHFAHHELGMGTPQPSEPLDPNNPSAEPDKPEPHLTGQELCEAIRQYALREYGLLAKTVLKGWGITSTSDFGEIVYNLIRIGLMRKTKNDRREDFDNVYDFDTAFEKGFQITLPAP